MKRLRLAICDSDEIYCQRLYGYLKNNLNLSFDIFSFTDTGILQRFTEKEPVSLLVVTESMMYDLTESIRKKYFRNILVLDEEASPAGMLCESGALEDVTIRHISKFQQASGIVDELIDFCAESSEDFRGLSTQMKMADCKVLGFYTPITKCGQTTMALRVADKLARKGSVLFLSFESFSSLSQLLGTNADQDITDLIYYAECENSKFGLYLEKIKKTVNGVDFILPAKTAMQIKEISFDKVKELLGLLSSSVGYDYVILDLTEYPEGFFDILTLCDRIFTISRSNLADSARLQQYEAVVRENGFGDIESRTVKCVLPDIRDKRGYETCLDQLLEQEVLTDGSKN